MTGFNNTISMYIQQIIHFHISTNQHKLENYRFIPNPESFSANPNQLWPFLHHRPILSSIPRQPFLCYVTLTLTLILTCHKKSLSRMGFPPKTQVTSRLPKSNHPHLTEFLKLSSGNVHENKCPSESPLNNSFKSLER